MTLHAGPDEADQRWEQSTDLGVALDVIVNRLKQTRHLIKSIEVAEVSRVNVKVTNISVFCWLGNLKMSFSTPHPIWGQGGSRKTSWSVVYPAHCFRNSIKAVIKELLHQQSYVCNSTINQFNILTSDTEQCHIPYAKMLYWKPR